MDFVKVTFQRYTYKDQPRSKIAKYEKSGLAVKI